MKNGTQQAEILDQMSRITRMRRGKLTEQYNRKQDATGHEHQWGPYYTLQAWVDGKNRSERIRREDVSLVRDDMRNHAQFCELTERYIEIAEQTAKANLSDAKKKPKSCRKRAGARPKPRSI